MEKLGKSRCTMNHLQTTTGNKNKGMTLNLRCVKMTMTNKMLIEEIYTDYNCYTVMVSVYLQNKNYTIYVKIFCTTQAGELFINAYKCC